jgi:hypothetical protein
MKEARTAAMLKQYEKENIELRNHIFSLQGEVYGARLAAKYLDKELAGRCVLQVLLMLTRGGSSKVFLGGGVLVRAPVDNFLGEKNFRTSTLSIFQIRTLEMPFPAIWAFLYPPCTHVDQGQQGCAPLCTPPINPPLMLTLQNQSNFNY